MHTDGYKRMAWPLLCTYLRGEPRKFGTPHFNIRMLHAKGVCIANAEVKNGSSLAFPSAS